LPVSQLVLPVSQLAFFLFAWQFRQSPGVYGRVQIRQVRRRLLPLDQAACHFRQP
jgi:hypothetical protein